MTDFYPGPNSITFTVNNGTKEVLRLDAEGFHYMGRTIDDAGEAYRLLREWMAVATEEITRGPLWQTQ